jgi:methylmalonyl-CoA/ethylmalonyl-CoA epimerase
VIDGIDLDHVAVAVERWDDAWPRFATDLGGRWRSGGQGPGFAPSQLSYANQMKVEVIAPHDVEHNDFLRRFLDRHGAGPHHLTYKVADIDAALRESDAAGYPPVNVDLSDAEWKEAFLHPRHAGVVVQLAQASGPGWSTPAPDGFPVTRRAPASLVHVSHAVPDLDAAMALFATLLGGEEIARGEDEGGRWRDLAWPGPGRVRLVTPSSPASPIGAWLGERPGRVHHLLFEHDDPSSVPGTVPLTGGRYEIPPDELLGTRLVLAPATVS